MSLRVKLLSKLNTERLREYIDSRNRIWPTPGARHTSGIHEELIKDLAQLDIEDLDILDGLWRDYSYWMILHFKTKITRHQLNQLLDNQHIVSALAHILDEEQVMKVIGNGMFGLSVGDVLKNNIHYKRRYGF